MRLHAFLAAFVDIVVDYILKRLLDVGRRIRLIEDEVINPIEAPVDNLVANAIQGVELNPL